MKRLRRRAEVALIVESHAKYVLGLIAKAAAAAGIAVGAITAAGLALTLPVLGAVTVSVVGGYILIKKAGKVIFQTADSDAAQRWIKDNS